MRMWQGGTAGVRQRQRQRSAVGAAVTAGAGSVGLAVAVLGQSDLRGFVSESATVSGLPRGVEVSLRIVTVNVAEVWPAANERRPAVGV